MTDFHRLVDRAVIRLAGAETLDFLNGLVTNDVASLGAGDMRFAALLAPQGKIAFDFHICATKDGALIDVVADAAPALEKRLKMYRLRAKIDIAIDEALAVGWAASGDSGVIDPRLAGLGRRILAPVAATPGDATRAYHMNRRALGAPEFGADFGPDEVFLLDVNYDALNAVSYRKGCFVGQEVSSRMKRKGEIRKRTYVARFDVAPPAKGAAVLSGETAVGEILAAEGGVALALVRVDRMVAASGPFKASDAELLFSVPEYLGAV